MNQRITIFTGHYGSGKTEIALNYAAALKKSYKKVYLVDLDIVNPYFRTVDAKDCLNALGIEVIASEFAGSNVDMPTVPADIYKVFHDPNAGVVFDVGGDEDGAIALGQYRPLFDADGYDLFVVTNAFRPMTRTAKEIVQMVREIEAASRLRATGLVSNSNLAGLSTVEHVQQGLEITGQAAAQTGLPVVMTCAEESLCTQLPASDSIFPVHRYLKLLFE